MQQHHDCDRTEGQSKNGPAQSHLVPCFWCERIHPGRHPLSVCPGCVTTLTLGMRGSYPLNDEAIDDALSRTSPGNYALGFMDGGNFAVFYVGRSDSDVRQRLHDWVGTPSQYVAFASPAKASWGAHQRGQLPVDVPALSRVENVESSYTHFSYRYAASAESAFENELRNFNYFGGKNVLDNETEPIRATG